MSLIHRNKSNFFYNPEKTNQSLKIENILTGYKEKLKIIARSSSKPKEVCKETLSLNQALKIEALHQKTSRVRKSSLHSLISAYDQNCEKDIIHPSTEQNNERNDLFRSGVYYRSFDRVRGVGVLKRNFTEKYSMPFEENEFENENLLKINTFTKSQTKVNTTTFPLFSKQ